MTQRHRNLSRTVTGFAVVIVSTAIAAGCGGAKTEVNASNGAGGGSAATLNGAGSTFQEPLVVKWSGAFGKDHPDTRIGVRPV